jgi:hypothetical protein
MHRTPLERSWRKPAAISVMLGKRSQSTIQAPTSRRKQIQSKQKGGNNKNKR